MKKLNKLTITLGVFSLLLTACQGTTVTSSSSSSSSSTSQAPKEYTVTWKNFDGTILEVDEKVQEGTNPNYNGLDPVKAADEQYDYTFAGWTPSLAPVTSNIDYVATFKETLKKYEIVWKNYDGNVLRVDEVEYGKTPTYSGATPTKPQTDRFSYEFTGWSPEVVPVTGPAQYTATFEEGPRKYTVTWMNYNGVILETDNNVPYGTVPTYDGAEPQRIGDGRFDYAFKGWSPEVGPVTGDITYVATFTSNIKRYTVTWLNYDGSTLEVDENVAYGSIPTYDGDRPTKPTVGGFKQTFSGWSPEVTAVTGNQSYTAQFVNGEPVFSFDLLDYQLQPGAKKSDLQGAPWINSNLNGQINKIKKPSLKDDFYASVNYENILSGDDGAFGRSDYFINQALNDIFYGDETINNDILWAFGNLATEGDAAGATSYISSFNLDNYLSSKDAFTSAAPLFTINKNGDSYEIGVDDGYFNGNYNSLSMIWLYSTYQGGEVFAQELFKVLDILDNAFGVSTSEAERNAAGQIEYDFISAAYSHYNGGSTGYETNEIPWAPLKTALLDLGVAEDATIWIPNHYDSVFYNIYENYAVNKRAALESLIKIRIEFAYRFLAGIYNYKNLNVSLTTMYRYSNGLMFGDEAYIHYYDGDRALTKIATAAFPILYEQSYLATQGSEVIKEKVAQLITDILGGFEEIFAEETWLSYSTRQRAIRKIQMMKFESCYPDFYKNFIEIKDDDLDTVTGTTLLNRYRAAYVDTIFSGISLPSNEWSMMPTYTNNAFYSPTTNSFVILNGLVRGFLYSEDTEVLYGTLGTVIGHEITHGFDSSGSQFDEYGRQSSWWENADWNKFQAKVQKMVNFYNNITLYGDTKAIGEKNNTEATADMGGMRVMLHLAKKIPNFDYDLFFKSYAYVWCNAPFGMDYAQTLREDEHPFHYLRANVTLAQFDEFVNFYNIQPGDGMYIPENQRVKIW